MFTYDQMAAKLKEALSPSRWEHTLGVVDTAEALAKTHGVDTQAAQMAALLHDCAKGFPKNNLLKFIEDFGIVLDEIEAGIPAVWHAPVGSVRAHREFGVEDVDILAAIRYHTTGRVGMSRLEQIIYVADMIEPNRSFPGVDRLRGLAQTDLNTGCLAAFDSTIQFVVKKGALLHPRTVAARNQLIKERMAQERR